MANRFVCSQHDISDTDSDATIDPTDDIDMSFSDEERDQTHVMKKSEAAKTATRSTTPSMSSMPKLKVESSIHDVSDSDSDVTVDLSPEIKRPTDKESPSTRSSDSICRAAPQKSITHAAHSRSKSIDHEISNSDTDDEHVHGCCSSNKQVSVKGKINDMGKFDNLPILNAEKAHSEHLFFTAGVKSETVSRTNVLPTERPLCPYGKTCYRKNPSHFSEFRHTDSMQSTLKRKHSGTKEKSPPEMKRKKTVLGSPKVSTSKQASTATDARRPTSKSSSAAAILRQAEPLGFLLTKVTGIKEQHNSSLAIDITDILSESMGNLQKSAQFNFKIDIPWLVSRYALQFRTKPLLIIHGAQRAEKASLDTEAAVFEHVKLGQARLEIMYGTHHTKMMLLLYDNGMRVVIHTANLIEQDWFQKTQGVWVSPLFPKLGKESSLDGESSTYFKRDLLEYLAAYRLRPLEDWMKHIKEHNMSQANVFLIGSVPGRHTGEKKLAFGHLKLRKVLKKHGPNSSLVSNWPVMGQFSSIGSLGNTAEQWLKGEWLESLSSSQNSMAGPASKPKLQLIYPSTENVRQSLEGYAAGGSLPYSINTATKQRYLHTFFHHWHSDVRGRNLACPHIKTYLRPSPDYSQLAWFLVTSANLSKAAWGALEKNGIQLMIRSYELGVLFLPQQFPQKKDTFKTMKPADAGTTSSGGTLIFPLPYDLPPIPYGKGHRPWIWDIPYVEKPDTHGTKWCPPLK